MALGSGPAAGTFGAMSNLSALIAVLALLIPPAARAQTSAGAPWAVWPPARETCQPATGDARAVLARASQVLGLDSAQGRVLRMHAREIVQHNYESDRPYRPFLTFVTDHVSWLDVTTGIERDSAMFAFGAFGSSMQVVIGDDHATFAGQGTTWHQSDGAWVTAEHYRALDPRIVVRAWSAATDARVTARCVYRDYERTVLTRSGFYGVERLYVDPHTGFVAKLDREEPQYLWGQIHVEFVYATWLLYGATPMPTIATELLDGDEVAARSVSTVDWIPRDSSPAIALPDAPTPSTVSIPGFLRPAPLDTQRLGPHTFLLANPGYNELVTLLRDTVYILDATQSETRARADSAWIGRLFPGHHPITVVVTDLAWPHVAGVRFWVASGATIVSRAQSAPFLRAVVARRWTRSPDKLESVRPRPALRFIPVREDLTRSGIAAYAIDGVGSEGALMVWLPDDGVLWASDYVQQLDAPALYTTEVYAATCRAGITPTRVVAEHQPTAPWSKLTALVGTPCRR
jgi:hypothetical protein